VAVVVLISNSLVAVVVLIFNKLVAGGFDLQQLEYVSEARVIFPVKFFFSLTHAPNNYGNFSDTSVMHVV
jgi:hypothetical protein